MKQQIIDYYQDEIFLFLDGYDDAIIGIDENSMLVIYSVDIMLNQLEKDMSEEEALEYFSFNIEGAYMGEKTPIYCKAIK